MRQRVRGADHPHYRGGTSHDTAGYVTISSGEAKGKREHQLVAEAMLGRPLRPDEVVHHRNGDKADNRPANLQVVTRAEHARLHHAMGRYLVCRSCGVRKWHSPAAEARVGPLGWACRPCGGRWAR